MAKAKQSDSEKLARSIIHGIQEKKGKGIISLNLTNLDNSVSNYFVICHGNTKIQVEAIAGAVEEIVKKKLGDKPWHKEGFENAEWILLDYVDVVVHIFQESTRTFYNLEKLWADAEIKEYKSE
jgi:ribosome-associated protein